MEILEIGCGTGSTALAHSPFVKHIVATDLSERMLEIAREKARENNVNNVEFSRSSVDQLSMNDEAKDVILALSVLHLLEDRKQTIEKIHTWLKPNGVFISSTACIGDMAWFPRWILPVGYFLRFFPLVKSFILNN